MSYPTDYRGWLAKLVAFKPVSRDSNLPLIHYVRDYLQTVGIEAVLVHNPEKTKANLWATLPGEDGATKGGLVLSGHTDVVPVDGQKWSTDPFTTVEKDGKIYCRGASDMLGFVAIVLALTPYFLETKRKKPIHYAFSYDEEFGCRGVPFLIDYLKKNNFEADACVVGEPTDMRVVTGHKGRTGWAVHVHGKPIHSSAALMGTSCNAIEYASQIIAKIRGIALDIKKNGKKHTGFNECPFACMTTSMINGGNAVNTVPEHCNFHFSLMTVESSDQEDVIREVQKYVNEQILPEMKEEFSEATVTFDRDTHYPSFFAENENGFHKEARRICNHHSVMKMAGCEAGYFGGVLQIPTLICGPGSMAAAHVKDEWVEVSKMDRSVAFVKDITKYVCTGNYYKAGGSL
ncbi:Peptidase family M20/M25/M40/Peptidase dimerisation domain containing protein, putative [Angomonas deanei]|uniref:Peptidase family M20/M25/M40/Peptidase dimerisation domain containing protein, putative n=1 Tax=Angomonas deanei TaxID=59799 RepID=A0A7G2C4T5_9TRYP|nr:Peptidase family M20/M25/M40/Peptidase dimerisation domain containing protein, putative [Angomonas deanei]